VKHPRALNQIIAKCRKHREKKSSLRASWQAKTSPNSIPRAECRVDPHCTFFPELSTGDQWWTFVDQKIQSKEQEQLEKEAVTNEWNTIAVTNKRIGIAIRKKWKTIATRNKRKRTEPERQTSLNGVSRPHRQGHSFCS
jgi:hypothetical protein